jgi:hypothetical protein
MSELLSWLRTTIEGDKAAAEKLQGESWTVVAQDQSFCYVKTSEGAEVGYMDESDIGLLDPDEADHMCRHDPRDTIARCEAELALIARYEGPDEPGTTPDFWCAMRQSIEMLAQGYRHRPGFNPDWVSE